MIDNQTLSEHVRALPLINHTAVLLYTIDDVFRPGPENLVQSTLPLYELVILTSALILWIVLHIYFWKMVYFPVNDPYATPYGSAPPFERSFESVSPMYGTRKSIFR